MERLLLHIGLPKAASTFLQREVFPRLCGTDVQFKGKTSPGDWSDSALWRHVRDYSLSGLEEASAHAAREIARTDGIAIFSSEDFLNPFAFRTKTMIPETVASFERLDRAMTLLPPSAEVMIMVVIRHQADWLASFHFECLKQGYFAHQDLRHFWRFLSEQTTWAADVLNFDALDRSLRARYPRARICLIPLERLAGSLDASLAEVLAFLGQSATGLKQDQLPAVNKRHTGSTHAQFVPEDRRFMRRRLMRQILQPRISSTDRFLRVRLLASLHVGTLHRRGLPLDPGGELPELMARYADGNARLSQRVPSLHDLKVYGYLEGAS